MTYSNKRRLYRLIPVIFYGLTDSLPYLILGAVLAFLGMQSIFIDTFQSIDKAQLALCTTQKATNNPLPASLTPINQNQQGAGNES